MTGTIGLLAAFAAGAVSFLSPCVLPLVPGYVSYLAGQSARNPATSLPPRLAAFALGVCFVLGFSMVFILFGAGASALGQWLLSYRYELNILGGALVIAFGLLTVGLLAVYSAGLGLPFLASAVFTEALTRRIRGVGRIGRSLQMLSGGVMLAMGAAMVTGELTSFSYWLLATFPILGRIG